MQINDFIVHPSYIRFASHDGGLRIIQERQVDNIGRTIDHVIDLPLCDVHLLIEKLQVILLRQPSFQPSDDWWRHP